jgi:uncharacterized membrane protein HdeD (DUF308 family)
MAPDSVPPTCLENRRFTCCKRQLTVSWWRVTISLGILALAYSLVALFDGAAASLWASTLAFSSLFLLCGIIFAARECERRNALRDTEAEAIP